MVEGRLANADWEARFPGLVCGITTTDGGDFGISTTRSGRELVQNYRALATGLGFPSVSVPRQVHGRTILAIAGGGAREVRRDGENDAGVTFRVSGDADGQITRAHGVLLAATAADCVPVYLVAPEQGWIGLLHAGWRGTAGGVLAAGLGALAVHDVGPDAVHLHLGPAICGSCYEVGRDVLDAFGLPGERGHVDLREELSGQARSNGVTPSRISRSDRCTRCSSDRLHSHRADPAGAGRMAAYLGWRAMDV